MPKDNVQCSFSDPDMKIMPQSNKGWDYATNAQVGVDGEFQIIVACYVTDASNDKEQAIPLAQATMENFRQAGVELPKEENGEVKKIPATLDSGYYSEKAAQGMEEAGFDPYMATGRQKHNQGKAATTTPPELPAEASEGKDASKGKHDGREEGVRAAKGDRRTRVRAGQGSARLPPLLVPRFAEERRRMVSDVPDAQPAQNLAAPVRRGGKLRGLKRKQ